MNTLELLNTKIEKLEAEIQAYREFVYCYMNTYGIDAEMALYADKVLKREKVNEYN